MYAGRLRYFEQFLLQRRLQHRFVIRVDGHAQLLVDERAGRMFIAGQVGDFGIRRQVGFNHDAFGFEPRDDFALTCGKRKHFGRCQPTLADQHGRLNAHDQGVANSICAHADSLIHLVQQLKRTNG